MGGRDRRIAPGLAWVAEGLIHDDSGAPSATYFDHRHQLDKRRHKLEGFDCGPHSVDVSGDGDIFDIPAASKTLLEDDGFGLGISFQQELGQGPALRQVSATVTDIEKELLR